MPVIEIYPIPPCLKISPAAWDATPIPIKSETIRAWIELGRGIAIAKDRCCGRPKPHRSQPVPSPSFTALHLLEIDVWRYPTNAVKIAEAEAMRSALASDMQRLADQDALEPYHQMAIRSGTTLVNAMRAYVAAEERLRRDPVTEIARMMINMGMDPVATARRYLAGEAA